jgi:broad specificity phosphatase PhoE
MDIYLVRHGQSEANARLTTHLDSGLTPLGRCQAELTGERLKPEGITHAFVSPLLRTLQTIEPICEATGVRATAYPIVCEYFSVNYPGYLTFQGLHPDEIKSRFPLVDVSAEFPCQNPWWPQAFEDFQIAYDRAVTARDSLLARFGTSSKKVLIVSHADPIGRLIEAFTRVPPNPGNPPWSENCGITQLRIPVDVNEPAAIVFANDTAHLAPLVDNAA